MAGGRPAFFDTADELEQSVKGYFEQQKAAKEYTTITGLAYYLGFESRQSFYDYEQKGEFSYIIKRARLQVESDYENKLNSKSTNVGAIFALKNMGWKDTQQITHDIQKGVLNLDPLDDTADNRPAENSPAP